MKGTAWHNMWGKRKITINYSLAAGPEGTPAITSHHDVKMKAPVWGKNSFFGFLLKHLKLRLSVWLVKAELLSWRSLCKEGNALPGTSLSAALWIGKHPVLEILGKKRSSAGAVLKGTAGASAGICRHTSDHLPQQWRHQLDWKKESSSTSCWNISSSDCRFGWERLSFSAGALFARQAMPYQVPVLATLCR